MANEPTDNQNNEMTEEENQNGQTKPDLKPELEIKGDKNIKTGSERGGEKLKIIKATGPGVRKTDDNKFELDLGEIKLSRPKEEPAKTDAPVKNLTDEADKDKIPAKNQQPTNQIPQKKDESNEDKKETQEEQPKQTKAEREARPQPSANKPKEEQPKNQKQQPTAKGLEEQKPQQPNEQESGPSSAPTPPPESKPQSREEETTDKPDQEKNCPNCGAKLNPDGSCSYCGNKPQQDGSGIKNCPNCGAKLNPDGSCSHCGKQAEPSSAQPGQLSPEQQQEAAGKLQNNKQGDKQKENRGLRQRAGDAVNAVKNTPRNLADKGRQIGNAAKGVGNAIRNPKQSLGNLGRGIKNRASNAVGNIGTERGKLRREVKAMEKELANINDKLSGLRTSPELLLIKTFFPGIYAKLSGATNFGKNAKSEVIIKELQIKITILETAKISLRIAQVIAAIIDGTVDTVKLGIGTLEIIIGFIILAFCWIIGPIVGIVYFCTGFGTLNGAIKRIIKQIDDVLKPLKEKLVKEKRKLQLRRGIKQKYEQISQTDHLSLARNKQNQGQQQPEQEQQEPEEKKKENDNSQNNQPETGGGNNNPQPNIAT